jgi:site-specific DNA-methyltransferase (adenine-specific)
MELIAPCVLAGSAVGDVVLDPFSGSGTTGIVATNNDRRYVGIELNPEYAEISRKRFVPQMRMTL